MLKTFTLPIPSLCKVSPSVWRLLSLKWAAVLRLFHLCLACQNPLVLGNYLLSGSNHNATVLAFIWQENVCDVQIVTDPASTKYTLATTSGEDFLEKFASTNWNDYCLAHLFTRQGGLRMWRSESHFFWCVPQLSILIFCVLRVFGRIAWPGLCRTSWQCSG